MRSKILTFNMFWGFQKNKYFLGYEDFLDIILGHHKIGLYLRVISMRLGSFLKVIVQIWGILKGCYKFKYFLGCLKFLVFYLGEG